MAGSLIIISQVSDDIIYTAHVPRQALSTSYLNLRPLCSFHPSELGYKLPQVKCVSQSDEGRSYNVRTNARAYNLSQFFSAYILYVVWQANLITPSLSKAVKVAREK